MTARLDRIQRATIATIRGAVPAATALWAPSGFPRRALGAQVITALIVSGPRMSGSSRRMVAEPTQITLTITGASTADRLGLHATGAWWAYDAEAGDSDTDVRDALDALFTAADLPGVTRSTPTTTSLRFDAAGVPGLLWRPKAIGSAASLAIDSTELCAIVTQSAEVTIELQAYSSSRTIGASSLLADVIGGLSSQSLVALREPHGVAFLGPAAEPTNIPTQDGAEWSSRAIARLRATTRFYSAVSTPEIRTLGYTATTDDGSVTGSIPIP